MLEERFEFYLYGLGHDKYGKCLPGYTKKLHDNPLLLTGIEAAIIADYLNGVTDLRTKDA